mmetsp:Transcript_107831/g.214263  ORF Transcript_107831/g.214263 Transcript_107831/m.214263 type:complete len:466 (-) Transcript_107831:202-1599(-)|eukprot:CAMPEP_0172714182 /NCGR_PEP_ID=MMETSP1074-20121228/64956_1 /TAXON_ID=2916 /ORGANISM="Ceratium fusus, Strain PA161109" /LENGTH=465 /DNA_ID=CAMNT_0013538531 /DNA_START=130 /DNA_END=1527 /DNA_ORIENTATION=+
MMLWRSRRSSLPQGRVPSTTQAKQQDEFLHSGSMDNQPDPVARVLDWMGRRNIRDDVNSSSSTTNPTDNEEDDTCDDVPVFDAQRFDANGSSSHGEGAGAQVIRPSYSIKRESSTVPIKAGCASGPSAKCFTQDSHTESHMGKSSRDYFLDEETERWDQRQQRSGAVGRLVPYHEGQSPNEDVFLRGGGRHHIILAGLRDGGQAARAGVKVGDRLVSIDGKKDLLGLKAEALQEGLTAPVTLVFLGFVGKLEAEVRLRYDEKVCGIASRQEAVQGMANAPLQLYEERVFDVGRAPLFLAIMPRRQPGRHMQESDEEEDEEEKEDEDEDQESSEEVKEEEDEEEEETEEEEQEQDRVNRTVGEENNGRRNVHSNRDERQEHQPHMPTRQTKVMWRRTPGHSTSWTKHISEVAPCFELQRSDAHRLVKRALRAIDLQTSENRSRSISEDDTLQSPQSTGNTVTLLTA